MERGRLAPSSTSSSRNLMFRMTNPRGGYLSSITLGLNWYLNPNALIMTNYVYTTGFFGYKWAQITQLFTPLAAVSNSPSKPYLITKTGKRGFDCSAFFKLSKYTFTTLTPGTDLDSTNRAPGA